MTDNPASPLAANQSRHLLLLHYHADDAGGPAMWEFVLTTDEADRDRIFEDAFTAALRAKIKREEGCCDWDLTDPLFLADLAQLGVTPWVEPVQYRVHDWYEDGWCFDDQPPCYIVEGLDDEEDANDD